MNKYTNSMYIYLFYTYFLMGNLNRDKILKNPDMAVIGNIAY